MNVWSFDKQDSGKWRKNWDSLGHGIKPISCDESFDSNSVSPPCLFLIHHQPCESLTEDILNNVTLEKCFVMYVDANGCNDSKDPVPPRIHYSKRPVPSGKDLTFLASRFKSLCENLGDAGQDTNKIISAWAEWERTSLEQMIEISSPLVLMPDNAELAGAIAKRMEEHIKTIGSEELQLVSWQLDRILSSLSDGNSQERLESQEYKKSLEHVKSLVTLIQNGTLSSNNLSKWYKNYPTCLEIIARRLL